MSVIHISHSCKLDAIPIDVWALVSNYTRDIEWRAGVVSMTPIPGGELTVGTMTLEQMKLAGMSWRNEGVVVTLVPERTFSWRTTHGADAYGSRTVEALGNERTRLQMELTVIPHSFEKIAAPILARLLERNMRQDLQRIGELLRPSMTS